MPSPSAQELLNELLASMGSPNDQPQHVTGIIYGDSGGGKTIVALQLAQAVCDFHGGGDIIVVDAVNAWRSYKNHSDLLKPNVKRMAYSGKAQLDTLISALEYRGNIPDLVNVKVVILDEMSSMTDKDGDLILKVRSEKDSDKDPDVLTQPDMGATTERMRRTVVDLLKLEDLSVIFVAHQRNDEDKAKGYAVTRPRFMPKFSGTIREGLDFVAHMSAKQTNRDGAPVYVRELQVHPTTTVVAKTRIGGLPLKVTPDQFVSGIVKWLKGEVGNSKVDVVVPDKVQDSDLSDFSDNVIQ